LTDAGRAPIVRPMGDATHGRSTPEAQADPTARASASNSFKLGKSSTPASPNRMRKSFVVR